MSNVLDFKTARNKKEYKRKDAKVDKLKSSLQAARQSSELKSESAEKLKKLFRKNIFKKPSGKPK